MRDEKTNDYTTQALLKLLNDHLLFNFLGAELNALDSMVVLSWLAKTLSYFFIKKQTVPQMPDQHAPHSSEVH